MNSHTRPYRDNPLLRLSYSLVAPLYDLAISLLLLKARTRSLRSLPADLTGKVLLSRAGLKVDWVLGDSKRRSPMPSSIMWCSI